jgi:hypothetical protein
LGACQAKNESRMLSNGGVIRGVETPSCGKYLPNIQSELKFSLKARASRWEREKAPVPSLMSRQTLLLPTKDYICMRRLRCSGCSRCSR